MEGTTEGNSPQGKIRGVKEKRKLVTDEEFDKNHEEIDRWFEHKDDPEMLKRISGSLS